MNHHLLNCHISILVSCFSFFRQVFYAKTNEVLYISIALLWMFSSNDTYYCFTIVILIFFLYLREILSSQNNCQPCFGPRTECVSAPTGKLSSTYAHQLPTCRCNTVHSNFFIPVDNTTHPTTINWDLSKVHVLLVDEVINSKTLFRFFYQRWFTIVSKPDYTTIYYTYLLCSQFIIQHFLCSINNWLLLLLVTQLHKEIFSKI